MLSLACKKLKSGIYIQTQPFLYVMIYIQAILYIKEVCTMKKDESFEILIEKIKQLSPENQKAMIFLLKTLIWLKKCAKIRK